MASCDSRQPISSSAPDKRARLGSSPFLQVKIRAKENSLAIPLWSWTALRCADKSREAWPNHLLWIIIYESVLWSVGFGEQEKPLKRDDHQGWRKFLRRALWSESLKILHCRPKNTQKILNQINFWPKFEIICKYLFYWKSAGIFLEGF